MTRLRYGLAVAALLSFAGAGWLATAFDRRCRAAGRGPWPAGASLVRTPVPEAVVRQPALRISESTATLPWPLLALVVAALLAGIAGIVRGPPELRRLGLAAAAVLVANLRFLQQLFAPL